MKQLFAPTELVERSTSAFLKRFHRQDISASALLLEIAQWYGMLVPASDAQWTFVHRSIHDFLAAKHWVETGQYKVSAVEDWNGRAAYAACLSPDATKSILRALTQGKDLGVVVECFYNEALFDADEVAFSLAEYFARTDGAFKITPRLDCEEVYTEFDFFGAAPNDLLDALVRVAGTKRNRARDALLAYSLAELMKRKRSLPSTIRRAISGAYALEATWEVRRSSGLVRVAVRDFISGSQGGGA